LIAGASEEGMKEKYSMVVSRTFAKRLFGTEPAVGKHIDIKGIPVLVTGVMEDIPENTHFPHFDAAVNIAGISGYWGWQDGDVLESRGIQTFSLYLMTKPESRLQERGDDILECFRRHSFYTKEDDPQQAIVEPLEQVYFSPYAGGSRKNNSKIWVGIMVAVVTVILLLAVINYINLSIAQGSMRAKEMSVKKLLGSSRKRLVSQFIGESVVLCFLAFVLACCFGVWVQPIFNGLMGAHVDLLSSLSFRFFLLIVGFVLLLGIVVGAVPAWFITRFNAVDVMKGIFRKKTKGTYGKALIGFQFAVAIVLTVSTFVLVKQTHFMQNYDMGFNREHIARFSYVLDAGKKETLRNEVMNLAGVKDVAFVCGDPVDGGNNYTFDMDGRQLIFRSFRVDSSFFRMLGICSTPTGLAHFEGEEYFYWSMINGETQQMKLKTQPVWLNKEAVRQLDLGELPLEFRSNRGKEAVIGVVDNFHISSLAHEIGPLMISLLQAPERPWNMLVQLQGEEQVATFHEIERVYKSLSAGIPFEAGFLDDFINRWYERSGRMSAMIGYLCVLAVFLSAMGILAMATYFIQQRVKEIGIRRVNGAAVSEIIRMLMNGFMKWIVVAFIVACPVAYYV
ncbi:MAG: FtsX-like permease family protein, partial [Odoribacter sp.]|nr:FtsX-like permease family protein [Odoribacter sp.]